MIKKISIVIGLEKTKMKKYFYIGLFSLGLLFPFFSNADTLGYTSVGSGDCSAPAYQFTQSWTMPTSTGGMANTIDAYLDATGATNIQGAIFSDSGGSLGTLLATSTIVSANNAGWNVMDISYHLVAGTSYWLGMDTDSVINTACVYDVSAGKSIDYNTTPQWNTWRSSPSTIAPGYLISLYVNYTPDSTSTPPVFAQVSPMNDTSSTALVSSAVFQEIVTLPVFILQKYETPLVGMAIIIALFSAIFGILKYFDML